MELSRGGLVRIATNIIRRLLRREGAQVTIYIDESVTYLTKTDTAWVIVSADNPTEQMVEDIYRALLLQEKGIYYYMDVGTSSSVWGGSYCLRSSGGHDAEIQRDSSSGCCY